MKTYTYTVRFRGKTITKGNIREVVKDFKINATSSNEALDKARDEVWKVPVLQHLFYPSYSIRSVD